MPQSEKPTTQPMDNTEQQRELQKLIDESPELRALLAKMPPGTADRVWRMRENGLDLLKSGDIAKAFAPENKEDVKTFDEMNAKGEEMVFLCMRCVTLDQHPENIVPGCFRRQCGACKEEVYMSPGTSYSYLSIKNSKIICEVCFAEESKKEQQPA